MQLSIIEVTDAKDLYLQGESLVDEAVKKTAFSSLK